MNAATDLQRLVRQGSWEKDVVVWVGSEHALTDLLSGVRVERLDLLDLFDEDRLPADDDEARKQLTDRLRSRLRAYSPGPASRLVLVVRSVALLARYAVGVHEFYDWFCGTFGMVILTLDGIPDSTGWPDQVKCDPDRLRRYFHETCAVAGVYGEQRR